MNASQRAEPVDDFTASDVTLAWLGVANGVELCLLVSTLLAGIFALHVVTVSRPLLIHANLAKLIQCMGCAWIVSRSARVFTCCVLYFYPDVLDSTPTMVYLTHPPMVYYAEWVRVCGGAASLYVLIAIVVERIVATVKLRRYETQQNNRTVALAMVSCLAAAALTTSVMLNRTTPNLGFSTTLGFAGSIFTIFFFLIFERINRRRHRNAMRSSKRRTSATSSHQPSRPTSQYTLSERFQLTENIRIFRALKRICITISLFNAIVMSVVAVDLLLVENPTDHLITRSIFNFMVTLGSLVVMLTALTSTPQWKRVAKARLRRLLNFLLCGSCNISERGSSTTTRLHAHRLSSFPALDNERPDNRVRPVDAPIVAWSPSTPSTIPLGLMDADGKPLYFENKAANELYFKQLNEMWR